MRDIDAVARDVVRGLVSAQAAHDIYGVVMNGNDADAAASEALRQDIRLERVGAFVTDPERFCRANVLGAIGESLFIARDGRGIHVVSKAGFILSTGSTRWRAGAVAVTADQPPPAYKLLLHDEMAVTTYYCPASGTLLAVDFHRRDAAPIDDVVIDLAAWGEAAAAPS